MLQSKIVGMQAAQIMPDRNSIARELMNLIAVRKPYYALENVELLSDKSIQANIPIQLKDHRELPGISIAEAGRHFAILGSLIMAKNNPRKEKHYYLATDALFERMHNDATDFCCMQAKLQLNHLDKKEGTVSGTIFTSDNLPLYKAKVKYAILHEKIFERLFATKRKTTLFPPDFNPYNEVFNTQINKLGMDRSFGRIHEIGVKDCAGHFNNFPALPVARAAGAMIDLCAAHINHIRNSKAPVCLKRVEMHADSFLFAGDAVALVSESMGYDENNMLISAQANTQEKAQAVSMKCWFY